MGHEEWGMRNEDPEGVKLFSIPGPRSSILNKDIHVLMYICVAFCCQAVISCTSMEAMYFCCRKAKNSCFAPKTLIYGIFVANVAKNTTYAF